MIDNPISPKVVAASAGAGAGAAISTLINWLLGVFVWQQPATAAGVADAISAVPSPVSAIILLLVTIAGAGGAGYKTTDELRLTVSEMRKLRAGAGTLEEK